MLANPPDDQPPHPFDQIDTDGAGAQTSRGSIFSGRAYSDWRAARDAPALSALLPLFVQAGAQYNLPPALLAAIASRESNAGSALENGWGDNGNAYGIMQVDRRFFVPAQQDGPAGWAHILQATGILANKLRAVQGKHANWAYAWQLRGAVAAYNSGEANVKTQDGMDIGTTGNDYSADVWARAKALRALGFPA